MKIKKYLLIILSIFLFNINSIYAIDINNAKTYELETKEFDIESKNAILYNLTDNYILYDKNSNEEVPIASITKIMTSIIAIENIDDLDKEVTITNNVFNNISEYAQVGLKIGNKVTYRDLLYGVLLPSGADAVNALVLNTSKTKEDFIKLMNDKVKELNLEHTKFDNAIGMDSKNNYSTAHDIAIILNYALKNEEFYKIFTAKKYKIESLNLDLESTLLHYGKNMDTSIIEGAKSGYTDDAGVCLASISSTDDIDYLLVVLGANTNNRANAIKDSIEIYNYYIKNYSNRTIVKNNQTIKTINVKWGKDKKYNIVNKKNITYYLNNNIKESDIKYEYKGIEELNYKIKKGTKLGTVSIKYKDKLLGVNDIYLDKDIKYYHPIIYTIIAVVVLIIFIIFIKKAKNKKRKKRRKRRR